MFRGAYEEQMKLKMLFATLLLCVGSTLAIAADQPVAAAAMATATPISPDVTFETFKPVFQTDVSIVYQSIWKGSVNPTYALSENSALELMAILNAYDPSLKPVLFHSGPFGWTLSGGFGATKEVPWIKLADGTAFNAGLIADFWNHGYSMNYVRDMMKMELNWDHQAALAGTPYNTWVVNYPK
jgi:hypothetical protein